MNYSKNAFAVLDGHCWHGLFKQIDRSSSNAANNMQAHIVLKFFRFGSLGIGTIFCILALICCLCGDPASAQAVTAKPVESGMPSAQCPVLLNRNFKKLQDESDQSLCQYAGKVILIVNTASYCGFTGQYEGLEKLYATYANKGLVVLGFPSNDFSQEPGSNKEIADFCYNTYGVKFPMFSKTSVVGRKTNPLYADLAKLTGMKPEWNFHKYLIDRSGKAAASYATIVAPTDRSFVDEVERLLAQK